MGILLNFLQVSRAAEMMFLAISLLISIIQVQVINSLSCLPCCEDNTPPQTDLVPEDVPLAVSMLSGEPPSYEDCHWCGPPPEYCSTGQTVLDECGCCQVLPRGRVTSAVVFGAWMALVLMISSVCRRT